MIQGVKGKKPVLAEEMVQDATMGLVTILDRDGLPVMALDSSGNPLEQFSRPLNYNQYHKPQGSNTYLKTSDGGRYEWDLENQAWSRQRFIQNPDGSVSEWNGREYLPVVDTVSSRLEEQLGFPPLNCPLSFEVPVTSYGAPEGTEFTFPYPERFQWLATYALAIRWGAQTGRLPGGGWNAMRDLRDTNGEIPLLKDFLSWYNQPGPKIIMMPSQEGMHTYHGGQLSAFNPVEADLAKGCRMVFRVTPLGGWVEGFGDVETWGYVDQDTGGVLLGSMFQLSGSIANWHSGGTPEQWLRFGLYTDIEAWSARTGTELQNATSPSIIADSPWNEQKLPYEEALDTAPVWLRTLLMEIGFVGLP
jgi:hypothetical protein